MSSRHHENAVIAALYALAILISPSANAASVDACSLLTQAQVSAALGASTDSGSSPSASIKDTCKWTAAGPHEYVTLMFEDLGAYEAGKTAPAKTVMVTPVAGVGEAAYFLAVGQNVGLVVKKGNISFKVGVYGRMPIEAKESTEKSLASQVIGRL